MKPKYLILLSILLIISASMLRGQDAPAFGIKLSGYIKDDVFFDTRQTVAAREGHFLLWPSPEKEDSDGEDINARPALNMLAIQTMLKATIQGPDAFGAKTSGIVEADFFATTNETINLLRLRHAAVMLQWKTIEILAGQYWNPFFVPECFPATVSFNTGAPLQSFARNPQLRATYRAGDLKLLVAALSQRDYSTYGPAGANSAYLRNSAMPDMHLQVHYILKDADAGAELVVGAGAAYKTVVPRLESTVALTNQVYRVEEKVSGLSALVFGRLITRTLTFKLQARYGENISDVLAVSGFAVKEVIDPLRLEQSYTPLKSMTYWGEFHTNGKLQFGLFGGYLLNMGTKEAMGTENAVVYGLSTNIRSLYRLSPRIVYNSGKARLALELEYTSAAFGEGYDVFYVPEKTKEAANLRALAAVYYFF
ncbi:MAG TPA: hypothetical protein P5248_07355 [Bacteroidales bacterium]|nr:hypothetical protein [Bacteroidales bacterium]